MGISRVPAHKPMVAFVRKDLAECAAATTLFPDFVSLKSYNLSELNETILIVADAI